MNSNYKASITQNSVILKSFFWHYPHLNFYNQRFTSISRSTINWSGLLSQNLMNFMEQITISEDSKLVTANNEFAMKMYYILIQLSARS